MHSHPALYSPYNIHITLYTPHYTLNTLHPIIYTTPSTPQYTPHHTIPYTTVHLTLHTQSADRAPSSDTAELYSAEKEYTSNELYDDVYLYKKIHAL